MTNPPPAFGKIRSLFWPVHNFELKKLIPMLLLLFFILFNYTILRDTKDTLIVACGSGAETIPFLKFWGVLPCAVLFFAIYSKLSNKLSKPALFYSILIPFIVFFLVFATVLFPMKDALHPTTSADWLQAHLPSGFSGLVAVFRDWTFSLFYIMSELWGSVALSLLFWGFANDTTKIKESKRFYTIFALGANVSLICAGNVIKYFSNVKDSLPAGVDPWQYTLNWLMFMVVISGFITIGIYWWINRYVLTDSRFYNVKEIKTKMKKPKMTMKESLLFLVRSKYILCLAIIVLAYGVSINLVEVTWKSQLKLAYATPNEYQAYMGGFSEMTGYVTIFMLLFISGNVIRKFGWTRTALITPVVLLITGMIFFGVVIFGSSLHGLLSFLGTTPLYLAVMFGMAQNIMSKSSKYSLFDPTKEMAYIPLDPESKVKGKAAIDVVVARFGKAGGSVIQQALILGFGGLAAVTPIIGIILLVIIGAWLLSAKTLGKLYQAKADKMEKTEKPEPALVSSNMQNPNENAAPISS